MIRASPDRIKKNRDRHSPQQLMRTTPLCVSMYSVAPACASSDSLSHMIRGGGAKFMIKHPFLMVTSAHAHHIYLHMIFQVSNDEINGRALT